MDFGAELYRFWENENNMAGGEMVNGIYVVTKEKFIDFIGSLKRKFYNQYYYR